MRPGPRLPERKLRGPGDLRRGAASVRRDRSTLQGRRRPDLLSGSMVHDTSLRPGVLGRRVLGRRDVYPWRAAMLRRRDRSTVQ